MTVKFCSANVNFRQSDNIVIWFVFYSEEDYKATTNLIYGVAFETSVLAIKVFFLRFYKVKENPTFESCPAVLYFKEVV